MTMHFYRYVRPTEFCEITQSIEPLPRGGICLRFEKNHDGTLFFTYARCRDNELFNKEHARATADDRANMYKELNYHNHGFLGNFKPDLTSSVLINEVAEWVDSWRPSEDFPGVRMLYLEVEFRELSHALESILVQNTKTELAHTTYENNTR